MKYTPRLPTSNSNVTPVSPLRELGVLLGGLMLVLVGTYFAMGLAVDLIAPHISPDFEKHLAKPFINACVTDETMSSQQAYVQELIDRLQTNCIDLPYTFTVHIQESPVANAAALPGGHILLFSGLFERVASENELAFILAHELGHYAHRDHLKGLGRVLVLMALSAVMVGDDSSLGSLLAGTLNLSELSFNRHQESQADVFALQALNCMYGHVGGATHFFETMGAEEDLGIFGHYFSTHPENNERIDALKALGWARGFVSQSLQPLPAELLSIPEPGTVESQREPVPCQ